MRGTRAPSRRRWSGGLRGAGRASFGLGAHALDFAPDLLERRMGVGETRRLLAARDLVGEGLERIVQGSPGAPGDRPRALPARRDERAAPADRLLERLARHRPPDVVVHAGGDAALAVAL